MTNTLRIILFECVHIITFLLIIGFAFLSLFMPSVFVFLEEIYIKGVCVCACVIFPLVFICAMHFYISLPLSYEDCRMITECKSIIITLSTYRNKFL